MASIESISKNLSWLPKPITRFLEKRMKNIPAVQKMVGKENDNLSEIKEITICKKPDFMLKTFRIRI